METRCRDCVDQPAVRCGRCRTTACERHAFAARSRCDACERDWADEAPTRRAAKMIFAPPLAVLVGGFVFGVLLPVSIGGAFGAAVMCALACAAAYGAGAGACSFVDRTARGLFLRERAAALPAARLLPSSTGASGSLVRHR
jgi:hypothetical protein|nr:hypothetical protein [Kofleriaceae bacterium]